MNHDHGNHDMPMGPKCTMHMLWNTQILDTCIIFPSWHISSTATFLISFVAIVLLGIFYEYLRIVQRRVDFYVAQAVAASVRGKRVERNGRSGSASPVGGIASDEDRELLTGRKVFKAGSGSGIPVPFVYRFLRAGLYGSTVFLSFFLMLVFMTYNAYLIFAVVLGAMIGHFMFGARMDTDAILSRHVNSKGMACH